MASFILFIFYYSKRFYVVHLCKNKTLKIHNKCNEYKKNKQHYNTGSFHYIYVKIDSDYAFVYREGRGFDVLELF